MTPVPSSTSSAGRPPDGTLEVVTGATAASILLDGLEPLKKLIAETYLQHDRRETVVPPTSFLRYGDQDANRFLALPALRHEPPVAGVKWLGSVPANVSRGRARAVGLVILSDPATGEPYACVEASAISIMRTAVGAVLAAEALLPMTDTIGCVGVIGAGRLSRMTLVALQSARWSVDRYAIHDISHDRAAALGELIHRLYPHTEVSIERDATSVLAKAELTLIATTAGTPHIPVMSVSADAVVLHLSLRDLQPEQLMSSQNIVDDVGHAVREQTSLGRATAEAGGAGIIAGTIADVLAHRLSKAQDRPTVVAPFGLGVLDIAVAEHVHAAARREGRVSVIPAFTGLEWDPYSAAPS